MSPCIESFSTFLTLATYLTPVQGLSALGRVLKGSEALSSSVQKLGAALLTDQV